MIHYLGYIEAELTLPIGNKMLETNAVLLVLPTTGQHKRIPISMGTTITDLVINFLDVSDFEQASQSSKTPSCTTQTRRQVQSHQLQKRTLKATR